MVSDDCSRDLIFKLSLVHVFSSQNGRLPKVGDEFTGKPVGGYLEEIRGNFKNYNAVEKGMIRRLCPEVMEGLEYDL